MARFLNKHFWSIFFLFLIALVVFKTELKRLFYPYVYGQKTDQVLQISDYDYFNDVNIPPFTYKRGKKSYLLMPKTAYAVTGRVGIVDHYDTLFEKFYRGQFQGNYMNLVPRDVFLVIGTMAREDIFEKFAFNHEERLGQVLCKGVKYRTSFMPSFMSSEKAQENMQKYNDCNKYIKGEELNNYHPIPATEKINKALSTLKKGDIVYLEGYLVDVPAMGLKTGTRKNQHHQNIIVNGSAPGMCFILYTTKVIIGDRVYE